jgi:hypothetical protein
MVRRYRRKGKQEWIDNLKPSIRVLCGPLMGTSRYDSHTGAICGVNYPIRSRRIELYREALRVLLIFRDREDLFHLALYRRQITSIASAKYDSIYMKCLRRAVPALSQKDWRRIAKRMPRHAHIRKECLIEANAFRTHLSVQRIAA